MEPDPYALPAFILSIVSLVVAAIGAATGIAALVWQIVVRTRGAHRVRVTAASGMWRFTDEAALGPYVGIEVRNTGAAPVQVTGWAVELPDGGKLVGVAPDPHMPNPALPHMLEAGTRATFYVRSAAIAQHAKGKDVRELRVFVDLATGKRVYSKRGQIRATLDGD
ncbi:hypothetical protein [Herbiconiux solani]|uniref:hypothetical protein n=1 Tax=Herbiconiux solani TaxID=661329 RepID=UPI0008269732|nr:hypothetical protein [Herbiconiux solani]